MTMLGFYANSTQKKLIARQQRHSFKSSPTTSTTPCCRPRCSCSFSEHSLPQASNCLPTKPTEAVRALGAQVGGENRRKQVSL